MHDEDFFKLDFNTLKLLKVLGEEGDAKRAAERLHIGQPAISKALKKLREQFDDPLFSRTTDGLEPTPKCETLLYQLPKVINEITELFFDDLYFTPASYEGTINIHINATLCYPLTNVLIERLHQLAPNATLQLENWTAVTETQLKLGQVDLGINYFPLDISSDIAQQKICHPRVKLCCGLNNPILNTLPVSYESIAECPLVLALMPDYNRKENYIETLLKRKGFKAKVLMRTGNVEACSQALKLTNALMPVSELVGSQVEEEGLALIDIDHIKEVDHYPVGYFIQKGVKDSAYSKWLISVVSEIVGQLAGQNDEG